MANQTLNGVLGGAGKKMAAEAVKFFAQGIWDEIMDKPKPLTIIRLLKTLQADLNEIKISIKNLSDQIRDVAIEIKTDTLDKYYTDIDSIYLHYFAALDALMAAQPTGNQNNIDEAKRELTNTGKQVVEKIHRYLEQIHRLLTASTGGSTGLLQHINEKYKSNDIVSHFFAIQNILTKYLSIQVKGISLLAIVSRDKTVDFTTSGPLINKIDININNQIDLATSFFQPTALKLIQAILQPEPSIYASILSSGGSRYGHYARLSDGIYSQPSGFSQSQTSWLIQPVTPITAPNQDAVYYFNLIYIDPTGKRLYLDLSGSQYGAVPSADNEWSKENIRWSIYSLSNDTFGFAYLGNYSGGSFNGYRLTVNNEHLDYSKAFDASDARQQFQLSDIRKIYMPDPADIIPLEI